jgi:hypothetical protein
MPAQTWLGPQVFGLGPTGEQLAQLGEQLAQLGEPTGQREVASTGPAAGCVC